MAVFDNLNASYSPGLAPEITKYYDRKLLQEARASLVHLRDLQKRNLPEHNGKVVNFRKFLPFTVDPTALKEGVTPAGQELKVVEIHAQIKDYGKHVEFTDGMSKTAIDDVHRETADLLARQASETLDAVAADALSAGSNVLYAGANGALKTSRADITAGVDVLSAAHIKRAVRTLEKANARRFPDGYYHAIVDPDTKYDLTACQQWIDIATYQNSERFDKYELGKMLGVKFFETTRAKTFKPAQYLYMAGGVGVASLALNGGAWSATDKTGYFTVAKATAYASGTPADYDYLITRMSGQMVRVKDGEVYMNALIDRATLDGSNIKFTLRYLDTASAWAYGASDTVCAQAGGANETEVHCTLVYGQDFGGTVSLESGGNIHTIMKPLGSSGALDPLNQRGSIAWKVEGFCVTLLQDAYGVRIEHAVSA